MPLKFEPWVGNQYSVGGGLLGVQVLVLGESHYGDDSWGGPEFTRTVIQEHGIAKPKSFFTKIVKVVLNLSPHQSVPDATRVEFWDSVAFYNYVQAWVGPWARHRPTAEMWQNAAAPFLEVLTLLRPAAIVVIGSELWDHLPAPTERLNLPGQTLKLFRQQQSQAAVAGLVKHVSAWGFRYDPWQANVQVLLTEARRLAARTGA